MASMKTDKNVRKSRLRPLERINKRPGQKPELCYDDVVELRQNTQESHREAAKRLGLPYHIIRDARFGRTWETVAHPPPWLTFKVGGRRVRVAPSQKFPDL